MFAAASQHRRSSNSRHSHRLWQDNILVGLQLLVVNANDIAMLMRSPASLNSPAYNVSMATKNLIPRPSGSRSKIFGYASLKTSAPRSSNTHRRFPIIVLIQTSRFEPETDRLRRVGSIIIMRVFSDTRLHRRGADAKYIFLNSLNALLHPREFLRDLHTIRKIKSGLESLARDNASADSKAPNIFHFVWGLSGKSEAFPYYAYMAVASALFYNPGAKAIFHYGNEPSGEFWDRTKSKVILNKVENFERFGIARLHHFAHKADVVRFLALEVIGGTYLDCDTLTAKSFTPLRKDKVVMGIQASCHNAAPGLCNATIVSPRRDKFLKRWLRKYRSFYSSGWTLAGTTTQSKLLGCYHFIIQAKLRSCPSITFSIRCGLTFPAFC